MRKMLGARSAWRGEGGATTAEYAVCTGAAVGFGGLLFKMLTSGPGQEFLSAVWDKLASILPF